MASHVAYLLDTHTLIWWWLADPRLSPDAQAILAEPNLLVSVSAVSAYEIGLKVRRGELPELAEPLSNFGEAVSGDGFRHHDLRHDHAALAAMLSDDFKDPFDRMIAAQALIDQMAVITRDRSMAAFGCRTIW